ncbi:TonB-dependent siderophore receptor [Allopusillimonas soli]|uniref:TonB-dependent siderophore receptor n=1 Tax=Allopusillimonas soli TaxID=659016 RepID=A0A853F7U8_9BURK|nr:TonB-dependent siderophore receptor [Allopusillimonas soli]NYT35898.1 TonB-dependent siderophore receptor [Allopusillimonas soli]TEA76259.1 TonB-dependent siderophore receptor [Allopusillimonas soli]
MALHSTRTRSRHARLRLAAIGAASLAARLSLHTTLIACAAVLASPVHAQQASQAQQTYDIEAGPLASVLNQFAQAAGADLSAAAELTHGKQSPGLHGQYSVQGGFMQIVQGHGLRVVRAPNGTYSLRPAPAVQTQSGNVSALAPVLVRGHVENPYGPVRGLSAQRTATATKTDTPILETPQTINIVTRTQVEMQGAQSVDQALHYTPGVLSAFGGTDSRYDVVKARGGLFVRQYLDGIVLPFSAYSVSVPQFDPYMLERIEVLQGPSSGLFGQTTPGGVLNMVSRRPQTEAGHEVWIQGGNKDAGKLAFDSTGPLDADKQFLYRITGLVNRSDGLADYSEEKRTLIAPSFTWQPSADTSLTLLTHYQHDKDIPQYQGLPADGTLRYNPNGSLPRSRFSGEPSYEGMDRDQYAVGYAFEHRFNDTWAVRQNMRYTRVDVDARGTPGYMLAADKRTLSRVATRGQGEGSILGIDTQAEAKFDTGILDHTLLAGVDFVKQRDDYRFASNLAPSIDLYDPVYDVAIPDLIPRLSTLQTMRQTGLYLQDQIRTGGWVFTAGGRYDRADADTDDRMNRTSAGRRDEAFTGRLGVNYVFESGIAPYASYATSFEPVGGTDYSGKPFEPMEGEQYEVGVKYQPSGSDMLFTLSAYQLTQKNMLTPDDVAGHAGFSTQTGEVRSRGINVEARAQLWEGTDVIAAYAYTRSKITKANPNAAGVSLEGRPLPRVPKHMASLWLNHEFSEGLANGVSVGVGVRYIGANYADQAATIQLPSNTLWDAGIHYDMGKANPQLEGYKLSLTGSNLTDRKYVSYCLNELQCFYGQGRIVLLSLRKQW